MKPDPELAQSGGFSIRIYVNWHARIGPEWNDTPLHNEYWRLYYNRQAGVTLVSPSVSLPIAARRLIIIPPRFQGRGLIRREVVNHRFVHFDVAGLPHGLIPLFFPAPMEVPGGPLLDLLVASWVNEPQASAGDLPLTLQAEALASHALAACWQARRLSGHPAWKAWMERSPQMARLGEWMEHHTAEDLSVARLAAMAGYTPDHFRRVFSRVFGVNPSVYAAQLRIKEAARLLVLSNSSIEEIAEQTGFSDRHHFTRVFRASTGETPAAYRKLNLRYLAENLSL